MSQDATLQRGLRDLFAKEGRAMILEVKDTAPVYNTATATVTVNDPTQVDVRGRLYRKRRRRTVIANGEQTDVWVDTQMAVLEARTLLNAPRSGDYLLESTNRWAILKVEPQQGAELVLTYELELGQG